MAESSAPWGSGQDAAHAAVDVVAESRQPGCAVGGRRRQDADVPGVDAAGEDLVCSLNSRRAARLGRFERAGEGHAGAGWGRSAGSEELHQAGGRPEFRSDWAGSFDA